MCSLEGSKRSTGKRKVFLLVTHWEGSASEVRFVAKSKGRVDALIGESFAPGLPDGRRR